MRSGAYLTPLTSTTNSPVSFSMVLKPITLTFAGSSNQEQLEKQKLAMASKKIIKNFFIWHKNFSVIVINNLGERIA